MRPTSLVLNNGTEPFHVLETASKQPKGMVNLIWASSRITLPLPGSFETNSLRWEDQLDAQHKESEWIVQNRVEEFWFEHECDRHKLLVGDKLRSIEGPLTLSVHEVGEIGCETRRVKLSSPLHL